MSSSTPSELESPGRRSVYFHTFGCKANQYDTEVMRQAVEATGASTVDDWTRADACVINTCTVTHAADAEARRFIRRVRREAPDIQVVVAGCSAVLNADLFGSMKEVATVVEGHDPVAVSRAVAPGLDGPGGGPRVGGPAHLVGGLVQLELRSSLDSIDTEPVGAELLRERRGATRGWLKVQDGCDRKCSFCATRLARGASRSRDPHEVVREAQSLARVHPELVITGIHIGHYGLDLDGKEAWTLSRLAAELLDKVPGVRFRLGSIEATEVDDLLIDLLSNSGGRLAPHLHMPLQSGADPVLRRMRRWHTREQYRVRALEICERIPTLGLGADVITGFPGETAADHESTRGLIEDIPFTYLHVFPFSVRRDTAAAELAERMPVPQRVAGERSRDLRALVQAKGRAYREGRQGQKAWVALEREGRSGLTGDYLRVPVRGGVGAPLDRLHLGVLGSDEADLYIDLAAAPAPI